MLFEGCQSRSKEIIIEEKECSNCGELIEIASDDVSAECDNCGFTIYNDTLSCVLWCEHAKECVGEEMYEKLIQIAEQNTEW